MSDYIKSETINGYTVNVSYDPFPDSPRNWDNLGVMYFEKMNHWNLGDKVIPEYWLDENGESWDIGDIETFKAWRVSEGDKLTIVLPIYVYEHSGIVLRTRQTTPAGVISGYIVTTKEKIEEFCGTGHTDEHIKEILSSEVDIYSKYVNGEVYYSEVKDGEEVIDSSGGFFDIDEAFGTGVSTAERLSEAEGYENYVLGKSQVRLLVGLLEQTIQEIPNWDTTNDEEEGENRHLIFQYQNILSRLNK